jgi:Ca2+-binding RTX toxin-like protein
MHERRQLFLKFPAQESEVSSITYSTAGTYTDTTNQYQFVDANGVILNSNLTDADVFVDGNDTITTNAIGDYVFAGGYGGGSTITLNAENDRFYGGEAGASTVTANGANDQVFGSDSTMGVTLAGSSDSFLASDGTSTVTITGSNATVTGSSGATTVDLNIASTTGATVKGGGSGNDTLNLTDTVADNNALTIDLGKNTVTNGNGLTISNLENLDYSISNPFTSARRTANTTFTTEHGTNTFDFSYSKAENIVYNTGGTDTVMGGGGLDVAVGGTGTTHLFTSGGNDYLYGGSGTNILQPGTGTAGTDYFYGGAGSDYFFGATGTGNEYFYGANGLETFDGGSGTNAFVEGTGSNTFQGLSGTDYVYGSSGTSNVTGGTGTDYLYTGIGEQTFTAGSGKDYLYEEAGTQFGGKLDTIDNFQTAAGAKGTFIFMPGFEAGSTSFEAGSGGTYIVTQLGGGQTSDILVAGASVSAVQGQTFFNL